MKFPFPFKSTEITITTTTTSAASSWPWPRCATNPKTLSFRATTTTTTDVDDDMIYKTISSNDDQQITPTTGIATATPDDDEEEESFSSSTPIESSEISRLRSSDRLFFEPGTTSSILEGAKTSHSVAALTVVMDSRNPFLDFRVSMEEMTTEGRGLRDWGFLEQLLEWYLRVNDESNHGYIVGAFIDLLIHLDKSSSSSSSSSSSTSSSSATKYCSTSPLSFSSSFISMENEDEIAS